MPISQERMMAVIMAGTNFKDAYESLIDKLQLTDSKIREAINSEDKQLIWDLFFFNTAPFKTQVRDAVMLNTENAHFRRNKRGNELRRGYQRNKREKTTRAKIAVEDENLHTSLSTIPTPKLDPVATPEEIAANEELRKLWNSIKQQE